jgi:hypothetical protein
MKTHSVFDLLIFTCFLVIGYTVNLRYYQPSEAAGSAIRATFTTEHQASLASLPNGQRSILMISVSSLSAPNPKLQGIWLASYLPGESVIQVLPIFPTEGQENPDIDKQLGQAFKVNHQSGTLQPDQAFLDILAENNYWWSGYIVYDQLLPEPTGHAAGQSAAQADYQDAHISQVNAMQSICHALTSLGQANDLAQVETRMPVHLVTDLDASQVQAELKALGNKPNNPTCRFPTLGISRIEP